MEILDKTEVRNKEEDVDMKKMHSITNIHPRYYDAAFYSYYRELNWNTSIFKEERRVRRVGRVGKKGTERL